MAALFSLKRVKVVNYELNINWYPGHMTKTKRQLEQKLKLIDIVVLVLDARAPAACINPDFEQMFQNKKKVYVLNKSDMANSVATQKWKAYFEAQGNIVLDYCAKKPNTKLLLKYIQTAAEDIYAKYTQKGVNKTVRVLVAGIPNVGKSAILNSLSPNKKLKEGNKPGVTRGLQWVKLTPYLELMDSPGMLWPKIEDEKTGALIALLGSIRQEVLDEEHLAYYLIDMLKTAEPQALMQRYKLDKIEADAWDILSDICAKRGFLLKKGEYNYERGAKMVLDEFKNAKIGKISMQLPDELKGEE